MNTLTTTNINKAITCLRKQNLTQTEPPAVIYCSKQTLFYLRYPKLTKKALKLNKNIFDKRTKAWKLIKEKYSKL